MLRIHGLLLLIAVGTAALLLLARARTGDGHHSIGRHRANVIALECERREGRALWVSSSSALDTFG